MSTRNEALASAYKELCEELSATLYDVDPAGMGSTVGAPREEYDGQAARIAAALRGSRSREEIASHLEKSFGECSAALVERVERSLAKSRMKSNTAIRTHRNG
jgi:hypothetical protein